MKHHIIVKFNPDVTAEKKAGFVPKIEALFGNTVSIEGVHAVSVLKNCIDRDNRFDIMIVIEMEKDALPLYDECVWHKQWKSEYSQYIDKKAIFDCE